MATAMRRLARVCDYGFHKPSALNCPPMRDLLRFFRSKWVRIGLAITAAYHFVWGLPI